MQTLFVKLCTTDHLYSAWNIIKMKNAGGGIDKVSILDFDNNLSVNLKQLQKELQWKGWVPEPYFRIEIKKNEFEKRKLGLLTIKDKIVQQAIKILVEPRFERLFLNNSYGYRQDKGHVKAIKRSISEFNIKKNLWVAQLDIDDFFDTVNHQILFKRLKAIVNDDEVLRLIDLSMKMGVVDADRKWTDVTKGLSQGAILSPLLANFYLHSFDQFVTAKTNAYIRYADDFILFAESEDMMNELVAKATAFLQERLLLKLNEPIVKETKAGIEFLGITLQRRKVSITETKKQRLIERIQSLDTQQGSFLPTSIQKLEGIKQYYAQILPQEYLLPLDHALTEHISFLVKTRTTEFKNKKRMMQELNKIPFFSVEANLSKKGKIKDWSDLYIVTKKKIQNKNIEDVIGRNKILINKRKKEYQKKESEGTELVVSTFGTFVGKSIKGIVLKQKGIPIDNPPSAGLKHLTIISRGVSISSDAIYYCMENNIPIDFFDNSGRHYASILTPISVQKLIWQKQANLIASQKIYLATQIITGKLKNQSNLIKYYHKYHKESSCLVKSYESVVSGIKHIIDELKNVVLDVDTYKNILMGYEAQAAVLYWNYVRLLLDDDDIVFETRIRKGATDLFNSLLNYGYSILYSRVWQATLKAKLNPSIGYIHAYQQGKPTLVYDIIELFRTQAVDRIVISLVQKREPLSMDNNLLSENTKKLLIKNILERLHRYEKYRGRNIQFIDIIKEQVKDIALFITEENNIFKPYTAKW